jgi:hypothetical protein
LVGEPHRMPVVESAVESVAGSVLSILQL